ncbi:Vacuolar protein 8 [Hondaea fermentalgiana]|uniref:Vacuolar protein 8 n=1 Tax=Hondaea fermentalgiana TaxID=2315210 RepID=A0A2R5GHU1_9STRA|nr:Vacuolar protein 8 [Hondaea fermentalgiana]|eukprot:GBG27444.1 Vacuolar protein 8 [Hondaea fermentalgiana]
MADEAGTADGENASLQLLVDDLRSKLEEGCPIGWSHAVDESGYSYFVQDATGETMWNFPPVAPANNGQSTGEDGSRVAALEAQIARLEKREKKNAADQKKVALRETAMKTDISKMKAESRQAKKELGEAVRAADLRCSEAQEATRRAEMQLEDVATQLVTERVEMIEKTARAIRERDPALAAQCMRRLRLGDEPVVPTVVNTSVQEAIDEFDAHQDLVARLRAELKDVSQDLTKEKVERKRENDEWRELLRLRDEEIGELKATVAERDATIVGLEEYIAAAEERMRIEIERARQQDANTIASLEAELALAKLHFDETMQELAEIWPDGVPPPSLLRKFVLPIRHREAAERQESAQERIRIGSRVQAWDEASACYQLAVVTAMDEASAHAEVRWAGGSDQPPIWVALSYCMAVVEEDFYKQKTQATQTDLTRYDDMLQRSGKPKRPRSAIGRMDGRLEAADRRASLALRERLGRPIETPEETRLRADAQKLFKLVDDRNQGEIQLVALWRAILTSTEVSFLLETTDTLQAMRRKEYLVLAWKEVDVDDDLSMPFDIDQFCDMCVEVRKLSLRPPESRIEQNARAVVAREISAAIQRIVHAQQDSEATSEEDHEEEEAEDEEEDPSSVEDDDEDDAEENGESESAADMSNDESASAKSDSQVESQASSSEASASAASEMSSQVSGEESAESALETPSQEDVKSQNLENSKSASNGDFAGDNDAEAASSSESGGDDDDDTSEVEEEEATPEDPEIRNLRSLQESSHDVVEPYFSAAQRSELRRIYASAVSREHSLDQLQDLCTAEEEEVHSKKERVNAALAKAEERLAAAHTQHDEAIRGLDATIEAARIKFTAADSKASLTTKLDARPWRLLCGEEALESEHATNLANDKHIANSEIFAADVEKVEVEKKSADAVDNANHESPVDDQNIHEEAEQEQQQQQQEEEKKSAEGNIHTLTFAEQEAFRTSTAEDNAIVHSARHRRQVDWSMLYTQLEKQKVELADVEQKRSQTFSFQVAAFEKHAARVKALEEEQASLQREIGSTEDENLKQGLVSKMEMLTAKVSEHKAGLNPLLRAKEEAKADHERALQAKQDFEAAEVELEALIEDAHMWEAEQQAKSKLVATCAAVAAREKARLSFWEEEVSLLSARSKQQREILDAMAEVKSKLDTEAEKNAQALLRNVEHQEVLRARLEFAKAQINLAENELDVSVAQNHLLFLEKEVSKGLAWAMEQWANEMALVDQNLAERARHLQDDCFRLRAAREAVAERAALRRLVAAGDDGEDEDKSMDDEDGFDENTTGAPFGVNEVNVSEPSSRSAAFGSAAIEKLQALRDLARQREDAWVSENVRIVRGLAGGWIADQEKSRLRSEVDLTLREAKHKVAQYAEIAMQSQKRYDTLHGRLCALEKRSAARESAYVAELETLARTSEKSIDILHAELDEQKRRNDEIERIAIEQLKMTEEDYLAMRVHLEEKVAQLEETLTTNRHWIATLQADIYELREQMRIFQEERAREERRLAAEKDQLRQELEAMTQHAARLDNWVNSLKNEVSMLQDALVFAEQEAARAAASHAQELRWLRWETWKRDETARTLGTNLDACFLFFTETVGRLAGTSRHHNERLAANAGIEVLHALLGSQRPQITRLALSALSAAAWDGHVDVRALSRLATDSWASWVRGISVVATLRWNRERLDQQHQQHRRGEQEAGQDQGEGISSAPEDVGIQLPVQGTTVRLAKGGRVIEIVPTAVAEADCGMNLPNQRRIGDGLLGKTSGVEAFIEHLENPDAAMVEKATSTLALLALEEENRERIGRALPTLLRLVTAGWSLPSDSEADVPEDSGDNENGLDRNNDGSSPRKQRDRITGFAPGDLCETGANVQESFEAVETRRYALSTICNLLYEHEENQAKFAQVKGVRPMLHICSHSTNVDLLESATLVLVNATSLNQRASEQLSEEDGLSILVNLCALPAVAVADGDVADRVQANVVEALTNATRDLSDFSVSREARKKIAAFGVGPLLNLMLSPSTEVQAATASIIANLAQDDAMRAQMGSDGAVESLFTMCESPETRVRGAALAALANLAWNASNQNRVGRLLPQLIRLCNDAHDHVRAGASGTLANALFYHEGNRRRFGLYTKAARTCVNLLADASQPSKVHENVARALGTAAYNDAVAMQAGLLGAIPHLLRICGGPRGGAQRTAAFALTNLAVHDVHKTVILRHGGVEIVTGLCASDCVETARHASRILEVMADMSRAEELEARRERFGIQGLVDLLRGEEQYEGQTNLLQGLSSVQVLACEQIAAEAASPHESKRRDLIKHGGHKALAALVQAAASAGSDAVALQVAQRALWALRIIMQHGGNFYQDLCGAHDIHEVAIGTLEALVDTIPSSSTTRGDREEIASGDASDGLQLTTARDVCEGAVGTLFVLCYQHERNSRRVLQRGLKVLINIADAFPASDPLNEVTRRLLRVMGPHSWIRCVNCSSKQKGGRTCSGCGHALANVFVD